MKILSIVLLMWFFAGCSDIETKHTQVTIQKDDVAVLSYDTMMQEFYDKYMSYEPNDYDANADYIVFRLSSDSQMSITLNLTLSCGVKTYLKFYGYQYIGDTNASLEYGALAAFTKQSLLDRNCLQEGGQLENISAKVEGYAEYSPDKVTTVQHTVSSNTIEYTAQEINEAFAVFDNQ